jgi:hypothetical protein
VYVRTGLLLLLLLLLLTVCHNGLLHRSRNTAVVVVTIAKLDH